MDTRKINEIIVMIDEEYHSEGEEAENFEELKKNGYPTELIAVDGSEHLLPRHIISGVRFFATYKETNESDEDYLNMACDCALYEAITTRIELNCKKIKNLAVHDDEHIIARNEIIEDCNRLGNLFWSAGYVFACRVALDIGNHYSISTEEESGALAQALHEEAVKHYYRAQLLMENTVSKKMIAILYKEAGLAACGWTSDESARADIFKHISDARSHILQKQVEDELAILLRKHEGKEATLRC